ncbi:YoaK family protein [Herbaspirillum sp. SJZ107]|uniref:YoaK family protein n=1 Tax=Herbaspirillum sp. SJZ107 TaxID=2572881 RepID=UPI00114F3914|nr:YoaK family protein [Herbaspirillum sp. SJZ107]TQK02808.1 uncharacterized membrane protein YoaK (UPF0700 family) [Herbaspirillum sp. SJZ107]
MNGSNSGRMDSRTLGAALAFLAGYVDALAFLALFGLFTAHVTGNFILIGAALADPDHSSVLLKLLAFPAFVGGVAAARILAVVAEKRGGAVLRLAYLLELVLLAGFMGFGIAAAPIGSEAGALAMTAGLLGTAAMGAHSATSRLCLGHLAPTSIMTGNVTQIVIDTVDVLRGADDPGLRSRFAKFLWPLLAFAVGCVAAAFGFRWFGFAALAVPVAILAGLVMLEAPLAGPAQARGA